MTEPCAVAVPASDGKEFCEAIINRAQHLGAGLCAGQNTHSARRRGGEWKGVSGHGFGACNEAAVDASRRTASPGRSINEQHATGNKNGENAGFDLCPGCHKLVNLNKNARLWAHILVTVGDGEATYEERW